MSAYIVFTRTKTIDQTELDKYRAGIKATMKVILSKCSQPMESTKSLKVIRLREWSL